MENLALHQRSLLLMVDVWRPACTWHRLHRTLFWVLIRQACSENHLTAHHDCSQMLQKMPSPLRLTATAVILTNVKQEATLSDAKRFLVVQKTHDFLCDLSKHSPDGFMGSVTSLNKTLNAFCKLWSFWEWEKNHPALSNEPSQSLRASGTPGFAHLTPRQWFQTLGLRRHEERAEAERHPHPQHEPTEREQTYLGPACGRRWEKSGIFIKTLILYFILFLITTALSVAKPPHPTAPPLIHVSRAGCS